MFCFVKNRRKAAKFPCNCFIAVDFESDNPCGKGWCRLIHKDVATEKLGKMIHLKSEWPSSASPDLS